MTNILIHLHDNNFWKCLQYKMSYVMSYGKEYYPVTIFYKFTITFSNGWENAATSYDLASGQFI